MGTPQRVVDGYGRLSDAGTEGVIMGFLDDEDIDRPGEAVMPVLPLLPVLGAAGPRH